jgi:hypothetical protein
MDNDSNISINLTLNKNRHYMFYNYSENSDNKLYNLPYIFYINYHLYIITNLLYILHKLFIFYLKKNDLKKDKNKFFFEVIRRKKRKIFKKIL